MTTKSRCEQLLIFEPLFSLKISNSSFKVDCWKLHRHRPLSEFSQNLSDLNDTAFQKQLMWSLAVTVMIKSHWGHYWKERGQKLQSLGHMLDLLLSTMAVCFRKAVNKWLTAGQLSLRHTSRLIQWRHFASPAQLTYQRKKQCMRTDMFTLKCSYTQMNTPPPSPPPPTYHLVWIFSVASYLLAGGFTPFSSLLCHQRTGFHFFYSVQNRNITGLSACPPPHTCVQKMHTHTQRTTDPHSLWTCLLLFSCQHHKQAK